MKPDAAGSRVENALASIEEGRRLTRAMIESAEAGDWSEVTRLDQARRPALESLSVNGLDANAAVTVATALRELVSLDARLVDAASHERKARLAELRAARSHARGSATYQKLASSG